MDELPEAYGVRRMHPESLAGSADSLFKSLGEHGGFSLIAVPGALIPIPTT